MAAAPTLVGRDAELEQLRAVVLGDELPIVAFVEGEAGIGKTALLETVSDEAGESGTRVLRARPTAAEAASSYAALDDLLRPAIDALPGLPAPQRRALAAALLLEDASEPVDPRLVGLAALSLIDALPDRVLLTIDDWQWLDEASAAVLTFVLRRLVPGRASVVATVRSGEADEALAALLRSLPTGHALELPLAPLAAAELGRLIHERIGELLPAAALARLQVVCGGNPLMALELVRAPEAARATDVRRLLARRLAALPPDARTVLRVVAALPEPTLAAVEAEAAGGLEAALAADVLVREGDRLRFSHPLIAAVVEERTPPADWRALHARLARAAPGQEQRARHLAAAAPGPDEAVAAALEAAAAEAEARAATGAAAELAERAAELTPDTEPDTKLRRLLAAAEAVVVVEDGPRSRRLLEDALARAEPGPARAQVLHKLAWVVADDSAASLSERALEEAGDDDALLADVHLSAALFISMRGEMPRALEHSQAAVRHAEAAGDLSTLAKALSDLAFYRHCSGEGVQREALMRADALEREGGGRSRDDTPLQVLGMQLYVNGDLAEARELLLAERERAHARGYLDHESFGFMLLTEVEVRAGRWELADDWARRTLDAALGSDLWNAEAAGNWARALVDAHLGRVDSARAHAERGRQKATSVGDLAFAARSSHVLGFLALSLGDADSAVRHLAPLPEIEARLNLREPAMFCIGPDLAEALIVAGDLDRAREVQADLEARGRELGRTWAIATALRCRGLIEAAAGDPDRALATLGEALEAHESLPQPFDRARTLLALGSVQRRAKRRAEARATLESALALLEELGAVLWAERARAEIARLGGRRASDRDELTETERRIAELAADGRSNREIAGELFVSERTVESNLTRAYRKLGVRSRTELARKLPAE